MNLSISTGFTSRSSLMQKRHLLYLRTINWIGSGVPSHPLPINYLPAFLWTKTIKPIAGLTGCWFNTVTPPFNNVKLRKAFAIAIPRKKLLEKLLLPNTLLAKRLCLSIPREPEPLFSIQECPATARTLFQAAQEELKIKRLKVVLSFFEATDEFSRGWPRC